MLFIRQNGDDSRPKNAATCPAFLDEICAKFGRTMTRHILLSLQKQLSVVSIIFGPSKKTKYTGRQRLRKNRTQNGYDEKSNRQRSFKTVFLKVHSQNNPWIVSSRKCRFFSTYKHTSTKSVRMYNVTFLEIRNVKTSVYVLIIGPKTSRYQSE